MEFSKKIDPENNKQKNIKQTARLKLILDKWQTGLNELKEIIVVGDDNIDSNTNTNLNKLYKIK